MYRKIIVGHDLHDGGSDALALGRLIADASGGNLIVAGVFPIGTLPHGFEAHWSEQEKVFTAEIDTIADQVGAEAEAFPSSSPARGLHELAEKVGADLIVVGSSRRGKVGRLLAGNVGLGLLHGSPCAVAVAPVGYRERGAEVLATIVVGFDASRESGLALLAAVDLARASGARINVVAVATSPLVYYNPAGIPFGYEELEEATERQVREQLDEALDSIPDEVSAEGALLSGGPAAKLAAAATDADVLVLGSRGYGALRRVLLGSVSSTLVRSASCPVVVHPRGTPVPAASGERVEAEGAP